MLRIMFILSLALGCVSVSAGLLPSWNKRACDQILKIEVPSELGSFPGGFGLNSRDAEVAKSLPETSAVVTAIQKAVHVLNGLPLEHFYVFNEEKEAARIGLGVWGRFARKNPAAFPYDFFEQFIKPTGADRDLMTKLFDRYQKIFAESDLDSDTLLVLAYASKNLTLNRKLNPLKEFDPAAVDRLLNSYFHELDNAGRLPIFKDFIGSSPAVFSKYADFVRQLALKNSGMIKTDPRYAEKLARELEFSPGLTLEQKVDLALRAVDVDLRPWMIETTVFDILLSSGSAIKKAVKWEVAGVPFFNWLIRSCLPKTVMRTLWTQDFNADKQSDSFCSTFSIPVDTREYQVFTGAFKRVYAKYSQDMKGEPGQIRKQMHDVITELGNAAKIKVRAHDRARQAEQLQARKSQGLGTTQVTIAKKKGSRDLYNRVRAETTPDHTVAEGKKQPSENEPPPGVMALHAFEIGAGPEDAHAGQTYYFLNFQDTTLNAVQYVTFSSSLLSGFRKKEQELKTWIHAFKQGRAESAGATGLKKLRSGKGDLWEIKIAGSGLRLIVQQDKASHTWHWLDIVEHNKVDLYRMNHRL